MNQEPRRRFDPLAVAFVAAGLVVIVAVAVYLFYRLRTDIPQTPPAQKDGQITQAVTDVRAWLESVRPPRPAPPVEKKLPLENKVPLEKKAPVAVFSTHCSSLPSAQPAPPPRAVVWQLGDEGRHWRYRVTVDAPAAWADATLTYRMFDAAPSPKVQAEFSRGEGRWPFMIGDYAAGHPSHAYMRFPGFFMLPVYLDGPLQPGARFTWQTPWPLEHTPNLRHADAALAVGWMWHLPQLLERPRRIKRYEAVVKQWEEVATPLGTVAAACIEATVSYIENGNAHATARETYWYAPRLAAVVKAMREGEAPDESARRITVELLAIEPPGFELIDLRPAKDRMSGDPGDGSFVAGDAEFSPDRLSLLRQHLAAVAGAKLGGKRVEVQRLVTWYVRTPQARLVERGAGLAPVPAEEYFDLPALRTFPYWVVCVVELSVDGRRLHGRGVVGFAGEAPNFASRHRQALFSAIQQSIRTL